jgi:anti-sigma factor (TIGR02949 family)
VTDRGCEKCEELLQDFLDRTLTHEEWALAESHLAGCEYCRRRYRFEETLRRYVKLSAIERMPPGLMAKLEELRGLGGVERDATA